jgi:uncharacterized protein YciI
MHYLLFYDTAEDYLERRGEFRNDHLKLAWEACDNGEMILAGAYANPVDGALLLFKGDSPEVVEKFVKQDPYVKNGLVKKWYIREWTTAVGETAITPIRPGK